MITDCYFCVSLGFALSCAVGDFVLLNDQCYDFGRGPDYVR
jgi:hypothetical protein